MARRIASKHLDIAAVVGAALRIADNEGLDALSMRRLASELNVTPMALYNHVDNKDKLIDVMADQALRALPEVDVEGRWDEELQRFFLAFHRLFVAHPAVADVTIHRPVEGPTAARAADRILDLLVRSGFSDAQAVEAFVALFNLTVGASVYRISRRGPGSHRLDRIDVRETPTAHRLRDHLTAAADEEHFERSLARVVASFRPV